MSAKHQDISDINFDSQDVFETSDHEDSIEILDESRSSSRRSSIEPIEYSIEDARIIFEKLMLSNVEADFSDKISNFNKKAYEAFSLTETPKQKLDRIKKELQELHLLKQDATFQLSSTDNSELDSLMNLVDDELSLPSSNSPPVKFSSESLKVTQFEGQLNATKSDEIPSSLVQDLSQRISYLEKVIGYSNSANQSNDYPIQSMLNDLYRRANLISDQELTMNEVRSFIEVLSSNQTARNPAFMADDEVLNGQSLDNEKITRIYNKLLAVPDFEAVLPALLGKLKSLNNLNTQLAEKVNGIDSYEGKLFTLETSINDWQDYLTKYESKLDEVEKKSTDNKEEVNQWINKLEEKLKNLS